MCIQSIICLLQAGNCHQSWLVGCVCWHSFETIKPLGCTPRSCLKQEQSSLMDTDPSQSPLSATSQRSKEARGDQSKANSADSSSQRLRLIFQPHIGRQKAVQLSYDSAGKWSARDKPPPSLIRTNQPGCSTVNQLFLLVCARTEPSLHAAGAKFHLAVKPEPKSLSVWSSQWRTNCNSPAPSAAATRITHPPGSSSASRVSSFARHRLPLFRTRTAFLT